MSKMKQRQGLVLTLLTSLCIMTPVKLMAAAASQEPSPSIQKDMDAQKYVTPDNKPLEITKRNKVEETQNSGINAGLYLEGLPTSKDTDGIEQFDPMFIMHNHFESKDAKFCDAASVNEGSNFACQSDQLLAHGDIKISTLLSGPLLDEARAAAAKWFIQNLIDPSPNTTLKDPAKVKEYYNDPSKQGELVKALAQQAILSVARQPFAEMVAKRSMSPAGMSVMQKMEQEATQKYLNADWQKAQADGYKAAITKKSGLEPLYDIAVFEAYRTWLEVERYKQGERIEALLAAMLVQMGAGAKIGQGVVTQTQETGVTESGTLKGQENVPKEATPGETP